jgi:branched-chain amino acid transport system permease protein
MTVLLTFSVALILEGAMGYAFTGIYRSTNPGYATGSLTIGSAFVPLGQLYAAITSVVLLLALAAFLYFTKAGFAIRATMQNRSAAQIVGVNVRHYSTIAFGLGMALAGASGSLMSYLFSFFPGRHWQWVALLLSLIVLGGLGSLKGAVIGALILAVASAFVSDAFGSTWSPLTFFLALFLILLIRPQGLFGRESA